jgi:hypothetical protein
MFQKIKLICKKHVLGLITYTNSQTMNFKLIRFLTLSVFVFFIAQLSAQKLVRDEFRAEVGITGGGNYYLGETNNQLFSNMRVSYSGFFRYRFNPRLAVKAELSNVTVAGLGINNNPVFIGDLCGEFNFFDLEQNPYKRYSKIFSPYISAGVSVLTDVYIGQTMPEFGLPFGIGMKVKLNKRWNLNVQWTNRLLFNDNLEGGSAPDVNSKYNNPNGLNGSNIFNNDIISTFTVGVSYDIWKKQCDCRNTH